MLYARPIGFVLSHGSLVVFVNRQRQVQSICT